MSNGDRGITQEAIHSLINTLKAIQETTYSLICANDRPHLVPEITRYAGRLPQCCIQIRERLTDQRMKILILSNNFTEDAK
ncbi:hypothetical protein NPIL_26341 [Nephila pilipes]|uniref:Uncharacterized protein n=1 Tax=Nephila pilipes TaxID=299642 RepID=A0A8X6MA02_NEPPI|nr:hypothetical protein NPIL_26341 [Nephila pilipes]